MGEKTPIIFFEKFFYFKISSYISYIKNKQAMTQEQFMNSKTVKFYEFLSKEFSIKGDLIHDYDPSYTRNKNYLAIKLPLCRVNHFAILELSMCCHQHLFECQLKTTCKQTENKFEYQTFFLIRRKGSADGIQLQHFNRFNHLVNN